MKVIQVKCPKCNTPISMKQRDKFFICSQCNTLHVRDDGAPEIVNYEIAEFRMSATGNGVYVPFWRFGVTFTIHSERIEGGAISRLVAWAKNIPKGGYLYIYVPAAEFDPATFKGLAISLTLNPPAYTTRFNFGGIKNMPAVMTRSEATEMADFIVVTLEAEQPGILQQLDYTLALNEAKIVYLPFMQGAGGLTPGM